MFLVVFFSWAAVVCVADLSVKGRGRESESWEENGWREAGRRERERGRTRLGERELCAV